MIGKALARRNDLVIQESGNEFLIYDLKINKAVCLNETSVAVWQLCDGNNTVSEISDKMSIKLKMIVSEDLVWLALDQLNKDGLLDDGEMVAGHFTGISRRDLIKKAAFASAISLPIISSVIAPNAVAAQSGCAPLCIPQGGDRCLGCTGNATFEQYNSTGGTCNQGSFAPFVFNCTGPDTASSDFQRN